MKNICPGGKATPSCKYVSNHLLASQGRTSQFSASTQVRICKLCMVYHSENIPVVKVCACVQIVSCHRKAMVVHIDRFIKVFFFH